MFVEKSIAFIPMPSASQSITRPTQERTLLQTE